MSTLDAGALPLLGLALALGARHGLDADHVAAIDALTRHNAAARPRLAAASGALFAIGHGGVVLAIAAFATGLREAWSAPAWLEAAGAWTSITLLLLLGVLNLRAAWAHGGADACAGPVGLKVQLLGRILRARHPASVAGVGAAFAVSFDTVSQTVLLAATAGTAGGTTLAVAACAMFVLGMVMVDGLGGLWAWSWFRRGSSHSRGLARRLAGLVGVMSIAMAALGVARLHPEAWEGWREAHDLGLSAALLLLPFAVVAAQGWRRKPRPNENP